MRISVVAAFALVIGTVGQARADDAVVRARRHEAAARVLRDRGDRAGASAQAAAGRRALAAASGAESHALLCAITGIQQSLGESVAVPSGCPQGKPAGTAATVQSPAARPTEPRPVTTKRPGAPAGSPRPTPTPAANVDAWEHALAVSPDEAAAALSLRLEASDSAAATAVTRVSVLASEGKARDATRLAQAVSARLDARTASLVLRMPAHILAQRWVQQAADALATRDPIAAMRLLADARRLAPAQVDGTDLYNRVVQLRGAQLAARARTVASRDPLLASAYFVAWRAVLGKEDVPLPTALAAALRAAAATSFALRDVTDRSWPSGARFHETLLGELRQRLPKHVALKESGSGAEWDFALALAPPKRTFNGDVKLHDKEIEAYRQRKPNPAWLEAANAFNNAIEGVGTARKQYEALHEAAEKMAANAKGGGVLGAVATGLAAGEEGGAIALVVSSQNKLRDASDKLQATPRFITEQVNAVAHHPVVVVNARAASELNWRLAGPLNNTVSDRESFAADRQAQVVLPWPDLQIEGDDGDVDALSQLEPDYASLAGRLAARVATTVASVEEARLQGDLDRAKASGSADDLAVAYVTCFEAATTAERREAALSYLKWSLR